MSNLLKAQSLSKTFTYPEKLEILKAINFELIRGKSVAVIGKSGSGKSTLLHLLGALDSPTSGTVEVCGSIVSKDNANSIRNRHIGFLFQSFHLLEELSVEENIVMPALIGRSSSHSNAIQLLEEVQLFDKLRAPVKTLSGGEKQRVGLVRALCNDPSILLADEPTGNLDTATSQIIHQLLLDNVKKRNKALLVVTHDNSLAKLCDEVYELSSGILVPQM